MDKKPTSRGKPDRIELGKSSKKKSKKKNKKDPLFVRILNRLLKLKFLKLLELSIGFVKGFAVKIEFFEDKGEQNGK
jgi:hypothetical protein